MGDTVAGADTEVIERGGLEEKRLGRLILQDDVIVGASLINLPGDRAALTNLIKNKTKITAAKAQLAELNFDLNSLNKATPVINP